MNITIVSDYYFPGNSRGLTEHCRQLNRLGHTVNLLAGTTDPKDVEEKTDSLPFKTFFFPYQSEQPLLKRVMSLRSALTHEWNRIEESGGSDFVLFNQPLCAILLLCPNFSLSTPFSYIFHAPWAREWELHNPSDGNSWSERLVRWGQKTLRRTVERSVIKRSKSIVTLSQYMQDKLLEQHPSLEQEKLQIIPGGVNVDQFHPPQDKSTIRSSLGLPGEATILFTLRRLVPRMGIDLLIRAFEKLTNNYDGTGDLHLVIGGEGSQRSDLEKLTETLNLKNVSFTGYVEEDTVADYYRAADLFVLPTKTLEGFGYVTLEALASGLPVMATPVGGTVEILDDFDRELYLPRFEPDDWASKISQILQSEKLSDDYSQRCRQYAVENYRWEKIGEQLNEHIQYRSR